MAFYNLQHVWDIQNNSVVAPFNMLTINRSRRNIRCFNQNYHPGKITLQVSDLMIKMFSCCIFWIR